METKKLDTIGQDCPMPLIRLKEAISESEPGQVIEVVFTCPEAVENLPNYAMENGHEVLSFEKNGSESWTIVIKKGEK